MSTKDLSINTSEISINDAIEGFLFHCRFEKNLNSKTLGAYTIDLRQFSTYVKAIIEDQKIVNVTKEMLKTYLQEISHFKPKTIKRKVASLKAMFNYLEYENDNYVNPFRKIKIRFKEPQMLPSVMTLEEVKKILCLMYKERENNKDTEKYTYKAQTRDIAIIETLFSTGMRVSEVCSLKLGDINMKSGVIRILGKGSKERIIQICNPETLSVIKAYYQQNKKLISFEKAFFINRLGMPLSTQSVRLMVKSYAQKAGFTKHITPHTFRHTFATLLLEEDVDIKYIQNMLGHSSIAITQIYTHVNMKKQKKILAAKHPRRKLQLMGNG